MIFFSQIWDGRVGAIVPFGVEWPFWWFVMEKSFTNIKALRARRTLSDLDSMHAFAVCVPYVCRMYVCRMFAVCLPYVCLVTEPHIILSTVNASKLCRFLLSFLLLLLAAVIGRSLFPSAVPRGLFIRCYWRLCPWYSVYCKGRSELCRLSVCECRLELCRLCVVLCCVVLCCVVIF